MSERDFSSPLTYIAESKDIILTAPVNGAVITYKAHPIVILLVFGGHIVLIISATFLCFFTYTDKDSMECYRRSEERVSSTG